MSSSSSPYPSAEHGTTEAYPGDCSRRLTTPKPSLVPNYSHSFRAAQGYHWGGSHRHPRPLSAESHDSDDSHDTHDTHDTDDTRNAHDIYPEPHPASPISDDTTPRNSVQEFYDVSMYKTYECPECAEKGQQVDAIHWWWWWDIGAILVSIMCLGLLAGVLVYVDNASLQSWTASIQPNSAISILTTFGKAAMLVPVANCLSQLKWRHITTQPRPLSHLQIFDNASRGPWGAVTMMWRLPLQSKLGWALALITVVAMAIDPSAQQILDFSVQERMLGNITAKLGKADSYYSKSFFEPKEDWETWDRSRDLPRFQASIVSALSGNVFQPDFSCPWPATRCEWPDLSSLGICSSVRNVTKMTTRKCEGKDVSNCTYTIPLTLRLPDGGRSTNISMKYSNDPEDGSHVLRTRFIPGEEDVIGQFAVVRHGNDSWGSSDEEPPNPEVIVSDLRWCKKTYRKVSASVGSPSPSSEGVDDEFLSFVDRHSKDGRWGVTLTTSDGKENYTISSDLEGYLPMYLGQVLTVELEQQHSRLDLSKALMSLSFLSTNTSVDKLMEDLAETLTNQLRTKDDGDNKDASTVDGMAFFREPVIVVRWEWFVLPAMEVFLTAVLLFCVIVVNGEVPLLKDSVMAFLLYPLRGWREEETVVLGGQTREKLDRLAEGMCGRMEDINGGYAIFKRY